MKNLLTTVMTMAVIILVQTVLSYTFTYQVGELFFKVSVGILLSYYYIRLIVEKTKTVR